MKASEARLLDFLKKSPQFVIPIYQRTYSWTEKECRQLWDDIMRCGSSDQIGVHFVGSIVYIEGGLSQVTHQAPLLVIDGQQRLTTVSLLLAALAEAVGEEEPWEGFSARKIRNYFLMNPEEDGEKRFKLLLSQTDRQSLKAIVDGQEPPLEPSLRIYGNFEAFRSWISKEKTDLATLCQGLAKLVVVDVALSRDQDNPQLIFESMNSTGKELSQADLVRNFILMGLQPDLQTRLYEQYWRPMEQEFGQEAYGEHFDQFMRNYLTVVTGEIPKKRAVYEAFKSYSREREGRAGLDAPGVEGLVKEIRRYSRHYCAMALAKEPDRKLKAAFDDLKELKVDVAYPLLLELYDDCQAGLLSREDLLKCVRLIESYVFRRAICSIPTNSMNKTFGRFSKFLDKSRYQESIEAHLCSLPSYRRFPSDEEFKRDFQVRDVYNFPRRTYWLRRLENHDRREPISVDEFTIEHILPQNEKLSSEWRRALGSDWQRIQTERLHTLGNLTLTAYNSSYSDRPFPVKRDMPKAPEKGLSRSPLNLNLGLGHLENWGEDEIKRRAERLAGIAVKAWARPQISAERMAELTAGKAPSREYSIDDHHHLLSHPMSMIFEAFRKEVLGLDPCVTEEFLKLYVAYKAETNFVDVVPQAKRLLLSLNLHVTELKDPKGICRDVSGLSRWGNGDVEVGLASLEEIPYVMSLVRQALERQLEEGEME
jgi:uncharacterized protein with ParB-like and HNH nuclease domain/predicted transport protein